MNKKMKILSIVGLSTLTMVQTISPLFATQLPNSYQAIDVRPQNTFENLKKDVVKEMTTYGFLNMRSEFKQYIHDTYFKGMNPYDFELLMNQLRSKSLQRSGFWDWFRASYYCSWALIGHMYPDSYLNCGQGGQYYSCTKH